MLQFVPGRAKKNRLDCLDLDVMQAATRGLLTNTATGAILILTLEGEPLPRVFPLSITRCL